jgi:hypothetical protein
VSNLKLEIYNLAKLSDVEQQKIRDAVVLAPPVLNYKGFHDRVLKPMGQKKGYTEAQILEMFLSGADPDPKGGKPKDGVIKLDIEGFYKASNTIGWTTLHGVRTYINRKYLGKFSSADVISHLVHETMHRFGFSHSGWLRKTLTNSVPYQYGYRFHDAWTEYYAKPKGKAFLVDERIQIEIIPPLAA